MGHQMSDAGVMAGSIIFHEGLIYRRTTDIHQRYGGQRQGGISTPASYPFIFLFTGETGDSYGYRDGWGTDGVFHYTGEGQIGDMQFLRGNKAIRDHAVNGRDLLLFQAEKQKGLYRFLGTFGCAGWDTRTAPDRDGSPRQVIVFNLVSSTAPTNSGVVNDAGPSHMNLADLRKAAYAAIEPNKANGRDGLRTYYARSATVRTYVLSRAQGHCEACRQPAPFKRPDGSPYLEPHHTRRLSDGGPDHPRWVGAICPTCHRQIHYGVDGQDLNRRLQTYLATIEAPPM